MSRKPCNPAKGSDENRGYDYSEVSSDPAVVENVDEPEEPEREEEPEGGVDKPPGSEKVKGFFLKRLLPGVIVGATAVVAAPFVLTAVGFTAGGIAGGSLAASMMSSAAIANGGGVAAGSLVALLQSAGAAGISAAANAGIFSAVSTATAGVLEVGSRIVGSDSKKPDDKPSGGHGHKQPM